MPYCIIRSSPVGRLYLAGDGSVLTGLWLEGQRHFNALAPSPPEVPCPPAVTAALRWLDLYFSGEDPPVAGLKLAPGGTPFQQMVWKLLCAIPRGCTVTYKALADEAAARMGAAHMAPRAIGGAVGRNPVSIIIPCHRVVGSHGQLTGYAGGLSVKRRLLELEQARPPCPFSDLPSVGRPG